MAASHLCMYAMLGHVFPFSLLALLLAQWNR